MPAAKTKTNKKQADAAAIVTSAHAARSHNSWRRDFQKNNPKDKHLPRMRRRGGVMVDINQPWEKLHPKAQADNLRAARDACDAVMNFPNDREAAADYVHKRWIARNKADKSQPRALFKPYAALPEIEKDKDRAHVDAMKRAIAAMAKPPAAKRAKAAHTLSFSAKDWRRLEAARARLAAALGRDVSLQALLVASAEAVSVLAGGIGAKPKSRRR